MKAAIELLQHMSLASKRYEVLREIFKSFYVNFKSKYEDASFSVKGIKSEMNLSDNYFDLSFLGSTWRFLFSTEYKSNGLLNGTVSCYKLFCFPEKPPIFVSSFTFNSQGESDIVSNDTQDPIQIDSPGGATYLIINCVKAGLSNENRYQT